LDWILLDSKRTGVVRARIQWHKRMDKWKIGRVGYWWNYPSRLDLYKLVGDNLQNYHDSLFLFTSSPSSKLCIRQTLILSSFSILYYRNHVFQ
jgi:hypothetical protein